MIIVLDNNLDKTKVKFMNSYELEAKQWPISFL